MWHLYTVSIESCKLCLYDVSYLYRKLIKTGFYVVFVSGCGSLVGQGVHNTASRGREGEACMGSIPEVMPLKPTLAQ